MIGLLDTSDECSRRAAAVKAVGDSYCAGEEVFVVCLAVLI